ncbi:hypothetical protein Y032_0014g2306 [Ancylostoma ceylanicum]|uniref:Uncharacterized protein n=1 Tax=Ancylostoma ceylanicum TaxID=53326 RepID=A0A016V8X2_9BILA|nr:hypothetical protein Y032_0014g2306 [Ancylostoma ceylanicum]
MPRSFINFSWVSACPSNIWRIVGYVLSPGLEFMVIFRFSADEVAIVGSRTTSAVYNPDVYCHWTPSIIGLVVAFVPRFHLQGASSFVIITVVLHQVPCVLLVVSCSAYNCIRRGPGHH